MNPRRERLIVGVMLLVFVALAFVFSLGPIFEGPDEIEHYRYVRILAQTRALPDPYSQPEGALHQAPLYYVLVAPLLLPFDDADFEQIDGRRNPYHGYEISIPSSDNKNIYLHTRSEQFPYRESGTALAVHAIRLLSIALGASTLLASYATFALLWPDRPDRRLLALGFVAFQPQFVYGASVISNDPLLYLLTTSSLYLWLRQNRDGPSWRVAVLLGIVLGAALLTEISAGVLVFPAAAATLLDRRLWRYAPLTLGVTLAVAGWWYARNALLYGDLLGRGAWFATWSHDVIQTGQASLAVGLRQLPYAYRGFWARFGYGAVAVGEPVHRFFDLLAVATLLGVAVWLVQVVREARWRSAGPLATRQAIIIAVFLLAWVGGAVYLAAVVFAGNTGRQFLPPMAAWGLLVSLGLDRWTPRRWRVPVALGGSAVMAGVAAVSLFGYFLPAYRVVPAPQTIEYRLSYRYGDAAELIGMDPPQPQTRPGQTLRVTLYWRALKPTETSLQSYLHTVDSDLVRRDSLPATGNLLSTDWLPGQTWTETYVLVIPSDAEPQVVYPLVAGLYDPATKTSLPATDPSGQEVTPIVGRIAVNGPPQPFEPAYRYGDVIGMAEPEIGRQGDELEVCLRWVSLAATPLDYHVFVHVLAGNPPPVVQADFQPGDGRYPTGAWIPGEVLSDCVTLGASGVPGDGWQVGVGLYDPATGQRLPIQDSTGRALADGMLLLSP